MFRQPRSTVDLYCLQREHKNLVLNAQVTVSGGESHFVYFVKCTMVWAVFSESVMLFGGPLARSLKTHTCRRQGTVSPH